MVLDFATLQQYIAIDNANQTAAMTYEKASCDVIAAMLKRPLIKETITRFERCNGTTITLSYHSIHTDITIETIAKEIITPHYVDVQRGIVYLTPARTEDHLICSYSVGWELQDIPEAIKMCIVQLVSYYFLKQSNMGIISNKTDTGMNVEYEKSIPLMVQRVVESYRI